MSRRMNQNEVQEGLERAENITQFKRGCDWEGRLISVPICWENLGNVCAPLMRRTMSQEKNTMTIILAQIAGVLTV
jgi:hypothetical protein